MQLPWRLGVALLLGAFFDTRHLANALDIPLEIVQPPTITEQSPATLIALSFDESFAVKCEAKGNPDPEFKWTKNGQDFDPYQDPMLITKEASGTFIIPNNGNLTEYQGTYRCYASNKFGTAMSEEIEFIIPNVPKFPKEKIDPIEVEEGQPFVLECNPPKGIPPLEIYWMTISMKQIEQDERVAVGLNGNLYFSNAIHTDSRRDYCCYASFPRIRTIVQKTAMSVIVSNSKSVSQSGSGRRTANAILERKPSLLSPSGGQTYTHILKGEELLLECIAEGFPTPEVEWKKIGEKLPDRAVLKNYGKHLTIEEVIEDDEGKYMCKAYNAHGEAVHYFHVAVEEPPKWNIEPKGQLNVIGADVIITCAAHGKPVPSVKWMVNGRPLSEVPATNRKVFDDTIRIHNASPSDSAVYQCEASNRHGTLLANANIMIMNLQPLILTEDNLQYSAVEGRRVIMHCRVFSSPPSAIIWSKDDSANAIEGARFSIHANGSLEIHSTKGEDDGEYTCVTENSEGKLAITALLEVKAPTKIVNAPRDQRVLVGTTVQFSCQAEVDPSFSENYEIIWEKDGIPLNDSESTGYFVDGEMLQIVNVSFSDQGLYVCVARSPVDQDRATALLTVQDVPDAPQSVVLAERKNRTVKLKWIPGDDHNSTITEFIIEYEENQWEPGRWQELVRVPGSHHSALLKLHGHVDYSFRISAINGVGKGQPRRASDRYKTPASAPDKNPENINIEAHLPHEMDINWKPLSPMEHNGPGLEYKVSYRRQDVDEEWQEHMVKRHSFVVKNTPTFVPYEVKIQAKNHAGWAPEPETIVAYSGEDFPSAAPEDVAVEVMNNTVVKVSWNRVHKDKLHGHLGGYRVQWWRLRSLLNLRKMHGEKHTLMFPGDRNHALIPGLQPFSEYSLIVMAYNGRGNGPGSHPVTFKTPEGVPDQAAFFRATDVQKHALTLSWSPPVEANGVLTSCVLQYQLINNTEEVGTLVTVNITNPDTNKWHLRDLEPVSRYRFYLYFCTQTGCGPATSEEYITIPEARQSRTRLTPRKPSVSPVAKSTLSSIAPTVLNISASVSDNFANISWILGKDQTDSELYVAYMKNREGNWKISEAVNSSKTFLVIKELEPGTEYTVRVMAKSWHDSSSIFEDVIRTRAKGLASIHSGISNQGWFIGLMCAVALLTLIVLIACFVNRNKGGKYSVKEKEDLHPDLESQGINDDTFCEYSDNDEKPLKGSQHSLSGDLKRGDSGDSIVDYGDEDAQFNEDGSFIGEYAGQKERASMEIKGTSQSKA